MKQLVEKFRQFRAEHCALFLHRPMRLVRFNFEDMASCNAVYDWVCACGNEYMAERPPFNLGPVIFRVEKVRTEWY